MDVTFFTKNDEYSCTSFEDIPEASILGGGRFTKDNISALLDCFKSGSSVQTDNLWLLSVNFSEILAIIDDEALKIIADQWAAESSWSNTEVTVMDLANNLLELKYAYSGSDERILVLFE